jgi:putative transcriptional regulator
MKDDDYAKLVASIKQAGEIKVGRRRASRRFSFPTPSARSIRTRLHVSQSQFAHMLGVSTNTVQNWEQGRREPQGAARALLRVAQVNPQAILDALHV